MAENAQLSTLITEAKNYCSSIEYNLQEDVCSVPTATRTTQFKSKTTVMSLTLPCVATPFQRYVCTREVMNESVLATDRAGAQGPDD